MKKVLVVDDDQDILTLVEMVLSMNNFKVEAISRWEEIKNKIESFQPDLILLDVALIGADGREICKQIKTASDTKNIPVILFSAHADVADSLDESMAQGFIAKPFEISHLVETLRSNTN
jgi:DNA-binding response OmpR family regulator